MSNNKKYTPRSEKYPYSDCYNSNCNVNTKTCQELCEPYTYFFEAPTTLYTFYSYPTIQDSQCTKNCHYTEQEINYKVYQIIDGVEHYVGEWLIKNKDTPNKKEFKECGSYVLRFCSSPPQECFPECKFHDIPIIYESSCNCTPIIERRVVCIKYLEKMYFGYQINCVDNNKTTLLRYEWIDYTTIPSYLTLEVSHMCDCDIFYINPLV